MSNATAAEVFALGSSAAVLLGLLVGGFQVFRKAAEVKQRRAVIRAGALGVSPASKEARGGLGTNDYLALRTPAQNAELAVLTYLTPLAIPWALALVGSLLAVVASLLEVLAP